jgi:hypothetical protein
MVRGQDCSDSDLPHPQDRTTDERVPLGLLLVQVVLARSAYCGSGHFLMIRKADVEFLALNIVLILTFNHKIEEIPK